LLTGNVKNGYVGISEIYSTFYRPTAVGIVPPGVLQLLSPTYSQGGSKAEEIGEVTAIWCIAGSSLHASTDGSETWSLLI